MEFEWTADGFRTEQVNRASIINPIAKEKIRFNQAHFVSYK